MIDISEILPHESDTLIRTAENKIKLLRIVAKFAEEGIEAIERFKQGQLKTFFDAQVGESLCQIRAYINSLHRKENKNPTPLQKKLKELQKISIEKKENLKNKKTNQKNDLLDILEIKKYPIFFKKNILFQILTFILSKYTYRNKIKLPEKLDYKKICNNYSLSKRYGKKYIHHLQKLLSKMSTDEILHLNSTLSHKTELEYFSKNLIKIADEGRVVLPCFLASEVIIRHALEKKNKIGLKIHLKSNQQSLFILCSPNNESSNFNIEILNKNSFYEDLLVFSGTSSAPSEEQLLSKLEQVGIIHTLLANQALHPQYPGLKLKPYRDAPFKDLHLYYSLMNKLEKAAFIALSQRYNDYKTLALKEGCWIEDDSLFLIQHIYLLSQSEVALEESKIATLKIDLHYDRQEKNQEQHIY